MTSTHGKRRITARQAKQHVGWGHKIYKKLRVDAFSIVVDYYVDSPPQKRERTRPQGQEKER